MIKRDSNARGDCLLVTFDNPYKHIDVLEAAVNLVR